MTAMALTTLGRLAIARDDFVTVEKLEPIYLREPHITMAKAFP